MIAQQFTLVQLAEIEQALHWRTATLQLMPSTLELRVHYMIEERLEEMVS